MLNGDNIASCKEWKRKEIGTEGKKERTSRGRKGGKKGGKLAEKVVFISEKIIFQLQLNNYNARFIITSLITVFSVQLQTSPPWNFKIILL